MKKISELRCDRNLIDNNFGGYFLSLTSIPSYYINLKNDVDQVFPSDEQYSYIHAKLFSLHNHLFHDPWSKNGLFMIDNKWKIQKFQFNTHTDVPENIAEVWEIPSNHSRVPGHYPTTLFFPSPDLVVLTDGAGTLHVVSREIDIWQGKYGEEVIGKEKPFLIADCRCEVNNSQRTLHVLLLHLEPSSDNSTSGSDEKIRTVTYLEWISLIEETSKSWSLQCVRQLKGRGLPDYLAFESGCKSIYIVSEHSFTFISDTENPIVQEEKTGEEEEKKKSVIFMWQQTAEDVKLWLNLEDGTTKRDVKILVSGVNFSFECKNKTILKGMLFHNIDHDLTTWTLEGNRLNIVLQKLEQGLMWKEVLLNNDEGEEILDEKFVQEVHERLSHLCSENEVSEKEVFSSAPAFNMEQLEDCDNSGESQMLSRIDAASHQITHQYTLAGHQWLFNVKLSAENAPAMCFRHDVHGCLWQPEPLRESADWTCAHLCTFPAFGYVHASKQNRKFSLCSTDVSFTVICESNNHLYIYHKDTTSDLRNRRNTGNERTKVGRLNCIKIESSDPILGAFSSGSNLFILLKNRLYQYHVANS